MSKNYSYKTKTGQLFANLSSNIIMIEFKSYQS